MKIIAEQETVSLDEGKFAPRDDPSRLSVNEKVSCLLFNAKNTKNSHVVGFHFKPFDCPMSFMLNLSCTYPFPFIILFMSILVTCD